MNNYSTENRFIPALEFNSKTGKKVQRISTGSSDLDNLFAVNERGGIETQAVTQFYGQSAAGKTQICLCLSVMVQQDQSIGGLDSKALYIDTEGKVRPERIEQIAKSRGFDPDKTLENIIIQEPQNVKEQESLLNDADILIHSQNIKLMVVDSIIAHYKTEYLGRANLSERQQRLYQFMRSLQKIAYAQNVAVIVTNHVQAKPDIFGRRPIAAGGNPLAHASTYVVLIRPSGKDRTALMISSPCHPVRDTVFTICERGIDNTDEEDFQSYRLRR